MSTHIKAEVYKLVSCWRVRVGVVEPLPYGLGTTPMRAELAHRAELARGHATRAGAPRRP